MAKTITITVYMPPFFQSEKVNSMSEMTVKYGSTLRSVLRELKIPLIVSKAFLCMVNHKRVPFSYRLKDGDIVSFLTPVGGG